MKRLVPHSERVEFSKRLNFALWLRGHDKKILYDIKLLLNVSQPHISELRNSKKLPSIFTGKKISLALNVSFDWLMTGSGTAEGFQMNNADEIALVYRYRSLTHKGQKELVKASFNDLCNANELEPSNKTNRLEEKQALLRLVVKVSG